VLTCSGGDSGIAADRAAELGLDLPPLSDLTVRRLGGLLPEAATIANPLDYTAMIWGDAELLHEIVATVGDDPAVDQLLALYDHPEEADASWAAVREGLAAGANDTGAAMLVASTLPDLLDERGAFELAARGVPAIAGLRPALLCARALRAAAGDPRRLREIAAAARATAAAGRGLGEWLDEAEVKEMLRTAGVPAPAGGTADDAAGCVAIARDVGWPVAVKLSGPAVRHKTAAGAVALGLADEDAVREAHARFRALPIAAGCRFLVERMVSPGPELLVAARADGIVPVLVVGLGGTLTEALDDVALVPLPASPRRVEQALRSLRGWGVLDGSAGGEAIDLSVPAVAAVRVGELLIERGLALIELNPVTVSGAGAIALDAAARRFA